MPPFRWHLQIKRKSDRLLRRGVKHWVAGMSGLLCLVQFESQSRLSAAAGLVTRKGKHRIRVYDLRHTHATLLLAAGVPVHVVSKRLGHANAKMTLDVYAHVLPGQQAEAVERMEDHLSAVR